MNTVLVNPSLGSVKRAQICGIDVVVGVTEAHGLTDDEKVQLNTIIPQDRMIRCKTMEQLVDKIGDYRAYYGFSSLPKLKRHRCKRSFGFEINPYHVGVLSQKIISLSESNKLTYHLLFRRSNYTQEYYYNKWPDYYRYTWEAYGSMVPIEGEDELWCGSFNLVSTWPITMGAPSLLPCPLRANVDPLFCDDYPSAREVDFDNSKIVIHERDGILYDIGGSDSFASRRRRARIYALKTKLKLYQWKSFRSEGLNFRALPFRVAVESIPSDGDVFFRLRIHNAVRVSLKSRGLRSMCVTDERLDGRWVFKRHIGCYKLLVSNDRLTGLDNCVIGMSRGGWVGLGANGKPSFVRSVAFVMPGYVPGDNYIDVFYKNKFDAVTSVRPDIVRGVMFPGRNVLYPSSDTGHLKVYGNYGTFGTVTLPKYFSSVVGIAVNDYTWYRPPETVVLEFTDTSDVVSDVKLD